jgi:predicted TIM-barrel fold metal-dependent hydrolase
MQVIDFRARPLVPAYAAYLRPRLAAIRAETGSYGAYDAPDQSVAEFVAALEAAGVSMAVFAARNRVNDAADWPLTNDLVAKAVAEHPDRLVGFGGLDLSDIPWSVEEMARCIDELGFRGFCMDPFQIGARADDDRLAPLYDLADESGVAVTVTMGGMPGIPQPLSTGDPIALDEVSVSHPGLVLVGSHSGWPFTNTMIAVAWRRPNVYFENSFYHFAPGAEVLVDAANQMIGSKMLYASAYPFAPLEHLQGFRELDFEPDVLEKVVYRNARGLLERIGALAPEST